MVDEWETIASRRVETNRKVKMPPEFVTVFEEPDLEASVFWNYERHSRYLVLSTRPLTRDNYQPVERTKIYTEGKHSKIRPPDVLSDVILSTFQEGTELFYLASQEMTRADGIQSVYLLTRNQLLTLLPEDATSTDSSLKQAVLTTPGFLPAPE